MRVNPGVDAYTHAKITTGTYENKFGIQFEQVEGVYARASKLTFATASSMSPMLLSCDAIAGSPLQYFASTLPTLLGL